MIAIRIDDVCNELDYSKFVRLIDLLDKHNLKALLGLIPLNEDADLKKFDCIDPKEFDDYIASLVERGYMVAMHGTHHTFHRNNTKNSFIPINKHSEFTGLSYDVQYDLLCSGKKALEQRGFTTNIFMAPAHTFDQTTLDCLEKLGFKYITDGYGHRKYQLNHITFLPCSISKGKKIKGIDTICLHPNLMSDSEFLRLDSYLSENRSDFVDYMELLKEEQALKKLKRRTQKRYVRYQKLKSFVYRKLKKMKLIGEK